MRWPSDKLMKTLTELQLCTRGDVAACQSDVHYLCRDLPDFDSVWIDALVQKRTLTPWQAGVLETADPERLRVGEYVIQNALGELSFLATSVADEKDIGPFVLHQLQPPSADSPTTTLSSPPPPPTTTKSQRLQQQLEDIRHTAPQSLQLPLTLTDNSVVDAFLVSRFVPGWSADELLIRGGRMPWQVVAEIGREVLKALSWLQHYQLCHGDICLRNVRVRSDGQAVLVSPFVQNFRAPLRSFTAELRLRDVETAAPELFGSGQQADIRSDMYSVGCVLWQMLTARPPFLSADPVNKIVKSQERDLPDVRDIVPDCPDWMARLIHSLARRSPDLRPPSCHDVALQWDAECSRGLQTTRRLLRRMPDRVYRRSNSHSHRASSRSTFSQKAAPVAVACLMIGLFTAYGVSRGLLPQTLRLTRNEAAIDARSTRNDEKPTGLTQTAGLQPTVDAAEVDADGFHIMPQPDAAGVVVLTSALRYRAADLNFAGVLHIETTDIAPAEVLIAAGTSWQLKASQVLLNNVSVSNLPGDNSTETVPMLECQCEVLSVTRCQLRSQNQKETETCLKWKAATSVAAVLSITDCVLSGGGYGLWMDRSPDRLTMDNVLITTAAAALRCEVSAESSEVIRMNLNQVSQVGGRGTLDVVAAAPGPQQLRIEILSGESVLAPSSGLVRVAGPDGWPRSACRVEFLLPERGNPTIVPPGIRPAVFLDRSLKSLVEFDNQQLTTDSLLIAQPVFATAEAVDPAVKYSAFELIDYEGPKLSAELPGVAIDRLP